MGSDTQHSIPNPNFASDLKQEGEAWETFTETWRKETHGRSTITR